MKNKLNKSIIPQGFVAQPSKVTQMPVTNTAVTHDDIARRAYEFMSKRAVCKAKVNRIGSRPKRNRRTEVR